MLHDHFDDDLEVPIDDLTDAQVLKFNFFECLAHYFNGSHISNRNRKAVELAREQGCLDWITRERGI